MTDRNLRKRPFPVGGDFLVEWPLTLDCCRSIIHHENPDSSKAAIGRYLSRIKANHNRGHFQIPTACKSEVVSEGQGRRAGKGAAMNDRRCWLFVGLFIALAFAKTPHLLLAPRFWAEEGEGFFTALRGQSLFGVFTHVHLGSYQVLLNVASYLSTLVPLRFAPTVTTYLALGMHTAVALQLAWLTRAYRLPRYAGPMLVAAWALLPHTYEVWLTTTNAQWIAQISVLVFLAMPKEWLKAHAMLASVWLLVCGLSGIPPALVAPAFLLRAVVSRDRTLVVLAGLLLACLCFQASIVATHDVGPRAFVKDPFLIVMPLLMQTLIEPFMGQDVVWLIGTKILEEIDSPFPGGVWAAMMILLGTAMLAFTVVLAGDRKSPGSVPTAMVAAWLSVTPIQTFATLSEVEGHVSGNAPRYYLVGAMCLCLLLGLGTSSADRFRRLASTGALLVVMLCGFATRLLSPKIDYFLVGPDWKAQVSNCPPRGQCILRIWPEGWTMSVTR